MEQLSRKNALFYMLLNCTMQKPAGSRKACLGFRLISPTCY